jgi:hypothetical protein
MSHHKDGRRRYGKSETNDIHGNNKDESTKAFCLAGCCGGLGGTPPALHPGNSGQNVGGPSTPTNQYQGVQKIETNNRNNTLLLAVTFWTLGRRH